MLATFAAVYVSLRETELFRSSAQVFLGTQSLSSALSNVQTPAVDPVRQANTQADLARTPAVAQRALRLAHLSQRSPSSLLANSSVTTTTDADILTFSVTDPQPSIAERLAEDYATAYTQYRRAVDTSTIVRARQDVERRLAQLEAAGQTHTGVYAKLLETDQQLSTFEVLQGSNAQLVRSSTAAVKVQPKPVRNGALAASLGLLLGIAFAFLRDAVDTRVRSAEEIEASLGLPQLGRLPAPTRRTRTENRLVIIENPRSPEAEPFRILATNLDFVNLERNARTIMFTSALEGEGKSTTVANLAVAYARSGRRVVLVDLDLRKPSLARLFQLEDHAGLTSVALGSASLDEALAQIPTPDSADENVLSTGEAVSGSLQVLPLGPPPPNPAEFMGSNAIGTLFSELERRADLILVDTSPILDLSDAMTLSGRVDGVVLVVRLSLEKRSTVQELRRVLDSSPTAKLGFVLTDAVMGETYSAYRYRQ